MSFLDDISSFSKVALKSVETCVRREDGSRVLEARDASGEFSILRDKKPDSSSGSDMEYGFVPDYEPDLQIVQVRPYLYMSSCDVAYNLDILKLHNITHILNVANLNNVYPNQFTYKNLPIWDLPEVKITKFFKYAFDFINQARNSGGRVLVHCNAGRSRSTTIVVGYILADEHVRISKTLEEIRIHRPFVKPNDGFMQQLEEYERSILAEGGATGAPT
ncbi:dual specificity protein phosphatase 19-like [Lytechinus variegatus]|uniref:dual specificity protein phosphatase 19-like n=1 Tax=Lytechinus variegatus TaxID=7654 RepID=UPI001BB27680|nr:dual specificity protein phosphatase 19-like [Lytechinus variegatus]XP_041478001.1 dual specificity protein phosphatase 19-like [Lytechinus variegatus]